MSQTSTPLYVRSHTLAVSSSLSGTASASCFFADLLMLIHYLHYLNCYVYCWRMLEDSVEVVPNAICGAIPVLFWLVKSHSRCNLVIPCVGACSAEEFVFYSDS